MSKSLEALERLKNTLLAEGYWQDVLQDVAIIENALNNYYRLLKEDDETTKKLKALDIIKSFPNLVNIILETVLTYGKDNVENYDLLKEVLL